MHHDLGELEDRLGHRFADPDLLLRAVTHSSWAHENGGLFNERLEFLGDAVLSAATAAVLVERYPESREGELSATRAWLVRSATLAQVARALDLGRFLRLGRGEEAQGGRDRDSVLENAYEAVLGAVYLDAGFEEVTTVARRWLPDKLDDLDRQGGMSWALAMANPRGALQERVRANLGIEPDYSEPVKSGPDHRPEFTTTVSVDGRPLADGTGRTKQEAFTDAAARALTALVAEDA